MLRVAVGAAMGAVGYLLVYCAVTDGGTFAARPWDALAPSAPWPAGSSSSGASSSSSSGGSGFGWLKGRVKLPFQFLPGLP